MKKLQPSDLVKFSGGALDINKECFKLGLATVLLWPLTTWVPYTKEWKICLEN